jgi:hypothetical protein
MLVPRNVDEAVKIAGKQPRAAVGDPREEKPSSAHSFRKFSGIEFATISTRY